METWHIDSKCKEFVWGQKKMKYNTETCNLEGNLLNFSHPKLNDEEKLKSLKSTSDFKYFGVIYFLYFSNYHRVSTM